MTGFWEKVRRKLLGEKPIASPKRSQKTASTPNVRVIVGLDFGTSGSKVVLRDALNTTKSPVAVDFGTPENLGFSRFVFPSTIAVSDGLIHFGSRAEREAVRTPHVFRSLKRSLIRLEGDTALRNDIPLRESPELQPFQEVSELGLPQALATLYLAEMLRRTRSVILELFGQIREEELLVHLDIPVSSLDRESKEAKVFNRILQVARILSSQLPERLELEEAIPLYCGAMESLGPGSKAVEERGEIVAEAVAAIAGLGETVGKVKGTENFVVIDIGAGTTDIGLFRYPTQRAERAVFYAAKTGPIGCDDIDHSICNNLGWEEPTVEQLGAVRLYKTRVDKHGMTLFRDAPSLTLKMIDEAVKTVSGPCRALWGETFEAACKKDRMHDGRWDVLDVFLVGGGSLIPSLRQIYEQPPRPAVKTVTPRNVSRDLSLRAGGASQRPPVAEDTIFLLTALGLSLPPLHRPEMRHPNDVKPLSRGRGPTGLYDVDVDDHYAK